MRLQWAEVRRLSKNARARTLISLCSKNCMMTFRRYSKLTSSSDIDVEGEAGRGGLSFAKSVTDDVGDRASEPSDLEAQ